MKADGWVAVGGSKHDKFEHPHRQETLIVPQHKELSRGVARSIAKLAGWTQERERMAKYFGIMDGSGTAWGVRVPDLPGCHGGGGSPEEALADVISAAREWAEHRAAKGLALPEARAFDLVRAETEPGEAIVLIPVRLDSGRPVKANLSLDAALLADIDRAARARGLTRSAFIASAATEKIMSEPT